jgi:hypothetical protein
MNTLKLRLIVTTAAFLILGLVGRMMINCLSASEIAVPGTRQIDYVAPDGKRGMRSTTFADCEDIWFQGFISYQKAQKLMLKGDRETAKNEITKAWYLFKVVQIFHSDWRPEMVNQRAKSISEEMKEIMF